MTEKDIKKVRDFSDETIQNKDRIESLKRPMGRYGYVGLSTDKIAELLSLQIDII